MDPEIRKGGDNGLPVSLAGAESGLGGAFYEVAKKVVEAAEKIDSQDTNVLEIS